MLPKSQRLNLKEKFKWVTSGKRIETHSFKLYLKLGDNSKPLIGITVPKHIIKKAHDRNKTKRVISDTINQFYTSLPNNLNLVIIPKGDIFKENKEQLKDELSITQNINH